MKDKKGNAIDTESAMTLMKPVSKSWTRGGACDVVMERRVVKRDKFKGESQRERVHSVDEYRKKVIVGEWAACKAIRVFGFAQRYCVIFLKNGKKFEFSGTGTLNASSVCESITKKKD